MIGRKLLYQIPRQAIVPGSATTFTVASVDTATLAAGSPAGIGTTQLYIEALFIARVAAGPLNFRAARGLGFDIAAGTLTQLDATSIVLATDFVSPALVGMAAFIDNSGTTIRGRITTVGAMQRATCHITIYGGYEET